MNVKYETIKKTSNFFTMKVKLTFVFLYFLVIFISELFYRDPLSDISIKFQEILQKKLENWMELAKIVSFIGGNNITYGCIFLITFNFTNIFKSYLLLMIIFINNLVSSVLELIYIEGRPYFISDNNIKSYGCKSGFGNPSFDSLSSISFFLAFYHLVFDSRSIKYRRILQIIYLFIFIVMYFIIIFSEFIVGANSLNQLIFGGLLGFGIYLIFFWLMELYTNDSKQLLNFIRKGLIHNVLINLSILVLFLYFYFFKARLSDDKKKEWISRINLKSCENKIENISFENESYLIFALIFANIFAFIGLNHEFFFTFKSNISNWTKYNFSSEVKEDDSFFSSLDFTKDTQWNHNNIVNSILRMLVITFFSCIILSPFFLISYSQNFWLVFFLKINLPISVLLYFDFYVLKLILRKLRLVNFSSNNLITDTQL